MAAKLRASLYHVFCLFHNHPPINSRSPQSGSPSSSTKASKDVNGTQVKGSSPRKGDEAGESRRRPGKAALRDAIPSMVSEASYVTNPYASGQTPPPGLFLPAEARRTPTRPPGLPKINIAASQAAATFLLPPLNFLPMVREHFTTAQHLASNLLSPTHALRLSVALEHAAFLWDCAKEYERARKLARRAIREVYSSSDGLDDDEFADASALVQALSGIVKRGSNESTPVKPEDTPAPQPVAAKTVHRVPRKPVPPPPETKPKQHTIDRTISVSPEANRRKGTRTAAQTQQIPVRASTRTPERLSTVPEVGESTDEAARSVTHATFSAPASHQGTVSPPTSRQPTVSPPITRLSSRGSRREHRSGRTSSTASASDKATKRKIVEQAEQDLIRRQSQSNRSGSRSTDTKVRRRKSSEKRSEASNGTARHQEDSDVKRRRSGSNASGGSQPHSRQATPPEGYVRKPSSNNSPSHKRPKQ
ncbi:uncharacterized protein RCC_08399 [Ramularia collo-cygni]|uniref:14-3-3 domain-containing protein n=1 Tax=Ramularia collo-cygni TaxID=112498 RepID=A0A2D3VAN4_9PEZI|nr:uncharacterized protein RCC_08399 [Ramularia collo-cygni]CZT22695.1 uncharacterized protein RCC_08399 [Ramularia collo-cygni]